MRPVAPALAVTLALAIPVFSAHAAETAFKACAGAPSRADEDAAKGLFAAGKTAYEEGDYNRAIQYWRDAFDRDCTANPLLLNLANAYERSGNIDAAVISLETYLKRKPDAADAPTIQKRIENMKKSRRDPAATTAAPPPPVKSAAPPPSTAPTTPPPPPPPPAEKSGGPGIAPWIVVGVGGVLTITGLVVYRGGSKKISDSEAACPNRTCPQNLTNAQEVIDGGNSGRSQKSLGGILTGAGLLSVAGGLTWYFIAKPKDGASALGAPTSSPRSVSAALVPEVAPGYGGLTAIGRF